MASEHSAPALVEAIGLRRQYGPITAVEHLDLRLHPGEILGLLGPNGAGKSTTMKMLTGNLAPSSGSIRIAGHDLAQQPLAAKRHLGYLPEQPPLYPELSVAEYLNTCAGLHGIPRRERAAAVAAACADCGLEAVSKRLIGALSKGYQQRVGIAQAIIHRPSLVILDEPTVGLDPIQIREIRALIAGLGRQHSVILSSHILAEIQAVCSRVVIINRGRLVYDAPLAQARQQTRIRCVLLRAPDLAALQAIPGVAEVEVAADSSLLIRPEGEQDPREAIALAAATHNWGLIELHRLERSLEDIFTEKTSGDLEVDREELAA